MREGFPRRYQRPSPQGGTPPSTQKLAEAYVPVQPWGRRYSLEEALEKGTLFPDLYRPYPDY